MGLEHPFLQKKITPNTGIKLRGYILYLYMFIIFNKMLLKSAIVGALILGFLVLLWIQRHMKLTKIGYVCSVCNNQSTRLNGEEEWMKSRINYTVLINYWIKAQSSITLM